MTRSSPSFGGHSQGNGLRYKLVLRPEEQWDGIGYTHSFDTKAGGEWESVRIPFSEFIPVFRAKSVKVGSTCSKCLRAHNVHTHTYTHTHTHTHLHTHTHTHARTHAHAHTQRTPMNMCMHRMGLLWTRPTSALCNSCCQNSNTTVP